MRQNVSEEAPKIVDSVNSISETSQKAQQELAETIEFQRQIIAKLEQEVKILEATFKKLNFGTSDPKALAAREAASKAFRELQQELNSEKEALVELEKQQSSYTNKSAQLRTQLMGVRDDMARLKLAGKEESSQYKELEEKLQSLGTAYNEVQRQQRALTTGGTQMAGVLSGLSALSGALGAGIGAVGLFNDKSEAMASIQTKLQSLIAITIGLQQVSNTLHSTSAFRITTVKKAKDLWATANIKVAATLGITNVQAQILMATLTLGLSVAITAVVAGLSTLISKSREAAKEQKEFQKAVADNASKSIADFSRLKKTYDELGDSIEKKKKFIDENKKAFEQLGVSVLTVNDADNLFINNTKAFKAAVLERAKALAAEDVAREKFREGFTKQLEASAMPTGTISRNKRRDNVLDEAKKSIQQGENMINRSIEHSNKAAQIFIEGGFQSAEKITEGTKAYWEEQQKTALAAMAALKDVEIGSDKWQEAVNRYNTATSKLKAWDINLTGRDEDKKLKEKEAALKKLAAMSLDIENDINAATSAAVEDNLARRLATIESNYEKRKNLITKRETEIAEIEKKTGVPATKEREALSQLSDAELQRYEAETKRAKDAAEAVINSLWADVNSKHVSELDNQLMQVDNYYDKQLEQLRNNIVDSDQLRASEIELEKKRASEKAMIRRSAALNALDFEEQIELRKQELRNENEVFESVKQEKLLLIQKEYLKKRLDLLIEAQNEGIPDLADDIELARLEIIKLDKTLEDISIAKLREIGNYVKQLASGLANATQDISKGLSDALNAVANNVDNVITAFSKGSTKQQKIAAGIDGLMQIANMITSQIVENKRQQEAWTNAIMESTHRMAMLRIETQAYEKQNIFGIENPYSRAIAGAKQYSEAILQMRLAAAALEEGKVQTGTKKVISASNVITGAAGGAAAGAAIGSIIPGLGTAIGAAVGWVVGEIAGLLSKKTIPVFDSLKNKYGEIYNKDTFEINPAILADYSKLDDATKKLVDNWQAIKDKAKEAQEQMRQNFSDLAGDIGSQLSSALVNAFREGDIYKGIDNFKTYMNNTIEDIVSQLIFSAHFQSLFNDLEKRFNDSFKEGGDGSIVDDMIWFAQTYKSGVEAFGQNLELAKEELKKQGIDIYNIEKNRTGATKGIAQASEVTMSEVSGGIYAMRMTLSDIKNLHKEQLQMLRIYKQVFDRITENTEYCRNLLPIREILDDIRSRGIIIR